MSAPSIDVLRPHFARRALLPKREAARALGVGRGYLQALLDEGLIGGVAKGRRTVFRIEDLAAYLADPRVPRAFRDAADHRADQEEDAAWRSGSGRTGSTSTTSAAAVFDFEAALARARGAPPRR